MSIGAGALSCGAARTQADAAMKASPARGTCMMKVARHEPWSRISPATAGAIALATAALADQIPTAAGLRSAEDAHPDQEAPPLSVPTSQSAAEKGKGRQGKKFRIDDPLKLIRSELQIASDSCEGYIDHRPADEDEAAATTGSREQRAALNVPSGRRCRFRYLQLAADLGDARHRSRSSFRRRFGHHSSAGRASRRRTAGSSCGFCRTI